MKILALAVFLSVSAQGHSVVTTAFKNPTFSGQKDTLKSIEFEDKSGNKTKVFAGQEIRIWPEDTGSLKGHFLGIVNNELIISVKGRKVQYPISKIKKLHVRPKRWHRFLSGVAVVTSLTLVGLAFLAVLVALYLVVVFLVILIVSWILSTAVFHWVLLLLALLALVVAAILVGSAGVLQWASAKLSGKVMNLRKGWKIKKVGL